MMFADGKVPCHEYGEFGVIPADVWLWSAGNQWAATNHREIPTWWDGADDADRAAAPAQWAVPIDNDPRRIRPGTLVYDTLDRPENCQAEYRAAMAYWYADAETNARDVACAWQQ